MHAVGSTSARHPEKKPWRGRKNQSFRGGRGNIIVKILFRFKADKYKLHKTLRK